MNVAVSIIVSTRNRAEYTRRFLNSLQYVTVGPDCRWELVLVDNGSTDHTAELVHSFCQEANYPIKFHTEKQRGKSRALNMGIAAAQGTVLAFTDDDVFVSPDWIKIICDYFDQNHDIDCIGGTVLLFNPQDAPITIKLSQEPAVVDAASFAPDDIPILGCNMAIRADALKEIGPFDIDIGPGATIVAGEDLDMLYRLVRRGHSIAYVPEMLVYHNHGRRSQKDVQDLKTGYMVGRGAFYTKYLLQKDGLVALWAYREIKSILLRDLPKIPYNQKSRQHLKDLFHILSGASTYLQIYSKYRSFLNHNINYGN